MPDQSRQLAAIMPARRSLNGRGPARRSFSVGGFTVLSPANMDIE